mgnify:CR=1 FL=1
MCCSARCKGCIYRPSDDMGALLWGIESSIPHVCDVATGASHCNVPHRVHFPRGRFAEASGICVALSAGSGLLFLDLLTLFQALPSGVTNIHLEHAVSSSLFRTLQSSLMLPFVAAMRPVREAKSSDARAASDAPADPAIHAACSSCCSSVTGLSWAESIDDKGAPVRTKCRCSCHAVAQHDRLIAGPQAQSARELARRRLIGASATALAMGSLLSWWSRNA